MTPNPWRVGRLLSRCFDGRWLVAGLVTIRPEDSLGAVCAREARARGLEPRQCRVEVIDR